MILKDKTAVITGCNRGIGFSILEIFSKNGANIIACVRKNNDAFSKQVIKISEKYSNKIKIVVFDLDNEKEIEEGFLTIKNLTKKIDILVNNAGINQMSLFQMTPLRIFRSVFETNFFSVVNLTQKMLKLIVKNSNSKIININIMIIPPLLVAGILGFNIILKIYSNASVVLLLLKNIKENEK